jgi:glutathione S-transferase
MLTLHHFDRSPFAFKVRIVLAEKKVPHRLVVPENKNEDPAFAKLNPFRLTPVLQLEDGRTLYESTIINEYLEETHPTPPMLPRDPYERARVRLIEDTTDQYLYPAVRAFTQAQFDYAPPVLTRKKAEQVDHKQVEEGRMKIAGHLLRLEETLGSRRWFGGENFSLADAALVPLLTGSLRLLKILPDPKLPRLNAWVVQVLEHPSVRQAAPREPARIQEA